MNPKLFYFILKIKMRPTKKTSIQNNPFYKDIITNLIHNFVYYLH